LYPRKRRGKCPKKEANKERSRGGNRKKGAQGPKGVKYGGHPGRAEGKGGLVKKGRKQGCPRARKRSRSRPTKEKTPDHNLTRELARDK